MRPNQSCGTCAHCVRSSRSIEQGECRYQVCSQMMIMPSALGRPEVRTFSYYPEVKLGDRGCSRFTLALEVCDA